MKFDNNVGIDYGFGSTNIDHETGIRYGVIHSNMVLQAWADDSEPDYPCGECDAWDSDNNTCCNDFGDCEPSSWNYKADGYIATQSGSDCDIFVIKSPFYTYAQFCSPCAPGACYLANPVEPTKGNKCYCFGEDWFDSDEPCPYPIWEVATGKLVYEPK